MHRRSWVVGVGVCVVLAACGDDGTASEGGTMMATSIGPSATEPTTMQTVGEASTADVPTGGMSMSQGETLGTTAGETTQDPSGTSAGPTSEGLSTGPSDMGPTCVDTCLDGLCVGEVCCPINQACAETCCDAGQVCSFQTCVVPGNTCVDATDCAEDEYCEYSLGDVAMPPMCMGGVDLANGKCLPQPPLCEEGVEPMEGEPITCLPECEVKPPANDFGIVLKASWGGEVTPPYASDIMMAPIVVQLDDDNCDSKVNEKDIPEIVFSTFRGGGYFKQGTLHAISLKDGAFVEKFSIPDVTQPGAGLAAADLDADGIPEIVGCMNPGPAGVSCCDAQAQNTGVIAFRADGSTFWTQPDTTRVHCGYDHPVIADVYQDGTPEVLVGWTLLDGTTGAVAMELDPAHSWGQKLMGMADLDGDGLLDVTSGIKALRSDGTKIWDLTGVVTNGYHAVGDFDLDGSPEVVIIASGGPHTMSLVRYDPNSPTGAQVIRSGVDINNGISTMQFCNAGSEYGGGPPTVADFNGDGVPDVGAAGAVGYIVFSGAAMMDPNVADADIDLWFKTTHDCSSAVTGSSVFDFNGDLAA